MCTLKEIKEMTSKDLVLKLVLINIDATKKQSSPSEAETQVENRISKELRERLNLN